MSWIKIFDSEAQAKETIPLTKARQFLVQDQQICVARTASGIFAVADACPHLGESLSKGTTNYLNEVVCPWHSYRYHLKTGAECKYRTRSAQTFPVETREDGIFIQLPDSEISN